VNLLCKIVLGEILSLIHKLSHGPSNAFFSVFSLTFAYTLEPRMTLCFVTLFYMLMSESFFFNLSH